ncbi:MAG: glycosyltransferase family 2 protein [Acidobacteria bacterium]|nr:glycosyltransferase family 2 protein [Acidobacteriota bacterium]MBI3421689.1 glycosyltransferase family 2 protein [Acidobacteriota bacterium]
MQTPLVFTIFNRPALTAQVLAEIRRARPRKLLVIADGPRAQVPGEQAQCEAARAVLEQVDWDCEVHKNYAAENLGIRRRMSSGLAWVFAQTEAAIVLEDDGLPHPTFFPFCEELLERYADDERVMHISGSNFQFGRQRFPHSYYFSRYNHGVGWASWRRAWRHYDAETKLWPEVKARGLLHDWLHDGGDTRAAVRDWTRGFQRVYDGEVDSWAYCWTFACWLQNGLSILPNVNLLSNIGFGAASTHTRNRRSRFANMPVAPIEFPLQHPPYVVRDAQADAFTQRNNYQRSWVARLGSSVLRMLAKT